jgi:hypothetical protein
VGLDDVGGSVVVFQPEATLICLMNENRPRG